MVLIPRSSIKVADGHHHCICYSHPYCHLYHYCHGQEPLSQLLSYSSPLSSTGVSESGASHPVPSQEMGWIQPGTSLPWTQIGRPSGDLVVIRCIGRIMTFGWQSYWRKGWHSIVSDPENPGFPGHCDGGLWDEEKSRSVKFPLSRSTTEDSWNCRGIFRDFHDHLSNSQPKFFL